MGFVDYGLEPKTLYLASKCSKVRSDALRFVNDSLKLTLADSLLDLYYKSKWMLVLFFLLKGILEVYSYFTGNFLKFSWVL